MNIIFPIGGKGQRFKDGGYSTPKPFIKVGDKRILDLAVESYPIESKLVQHLFLARQEYLTEMPFGTHVVTMDTNGPVETILSVKEVANALKSSDKAVMVADCDSIHNPAEILAALEYFEDMKADGGVTTRHTHDPGCSFCLTDKNGNVLETREKDQFTDESTTGPYWFRRGRDLYWALINGWQNNIRSISPLYNHIIKQGARVVSYPVLGFKHLGTPKELEAYDINLRSPLQ